MSKSPAPTTAAERLRAARISAGYATARAFYEAHSIRPATYQNHEAGTRKLTPENAKPYADALEVSLSWLLTGEGEAPLLFGEPDGRSIVIAEVDARVEGGNGGFEDRERGEQTIEEWHVPKTLLASHTNAPTQDLRIIRVHGNSMKPLFSAGDRVLVDLSDRKPSPPGIFVLFDGLGTVIKQVEFLAYSNPQTIKLTSANPAYEVYTRPLQDVVINGRVIARWEWT